LGANEKPNPRRSFALTGGSKAREIEMKRIRSSRSRKIIDRTQHNYVTFNIIAFLKEKPNIEIPKDWFTDIKTAKHQLERYMPPNISEKNIIINAHFGWDWTSRLEPTKAKQRKYNIGSIKEQCTTIYQGSALLHYLWDKKNHKNIIHAEISNDID
jgi:hypothetical protein